MLSKQAKTDIIKKHARFEGDTGSVEVQVAVLTAQIERLTAHMKEHSKDFHSLRGLLKMVGNRRSLLNYLKREDVKRYSALVANLGLRK